MKTTPLLKSIMMLLVCSHYVATAARFYAISNALHEAPNDVFKLAEKQSGYNKFYSVADLLFVGGYVAIEKCFVASNGGELLVSTIVPFHFPAQFMMDDLSEMDCAACLQVSDAAIVGDNRCGRYWIKYKSFVGEINKPPD